MLPKKNRLREKSHINATYKYGKNINHAAFYIKFKKNLMAESRIVCIVPKKVTKKAVERNTIRRQIIELLRTNWQKIASGYDIIITIKPEYITQQDHKKTDLLRLIEKLPA